MDELEAAGLDALLVNPLEAKRHILPRLSGKKVRAGYGFRLGIPVIRVGHAQKTGHHRLARSKPKGHLPMKRIHPLLQVLQKLCVMACIPAALPAQTFTTIDYPGAVATAARAINARGEILGQWQDGAGNWHGYLLTGGAFVGFDCQGALSTRPTAMNSKGEAVGTYRDMAGKWRGFYLNMALPGSWEEAGAKCVTVEPKGSVGRDVNTGAFGISEAGEIGSQFDDKEGLYHGVLTRGGVHLIFDIIDGVPWNGVYAVSPQGDLLGHVGGGPGERMKAWMLTRDELRVIEFPPAESNSMTCPFGANTRGEVVGHYQRNGEATRGFLYSKSSYVSIDVADASVTDARGINDDGLVVGFYTDKNKKTHGFLMRRQ